MIKISQVKEALPRIKKNALDKYISLKNEIQQVNVSKDREFQKTYNGFFRIRQKSEEFYAEYYKFMQQHKNDKELIFETVLHHLYKKAGSVEASFASKLLSLINPEMPVLDSKVIKNLKTYENIDIKPVKQNDPPEKRIANKVIAYEQICDWYENFSKSDEAAEWIELFDKHYPEVKDKITEVKKIDLILWKIGD